MVWVMFVGGVGLLAWLCFDVFVNPDGETRSAALRNFSRPNISRFDASPQRVAEWNDWARAKRAWAEGIEDRRWRRANLSWCAYFERKIERAEEDWQRERRVSVLAEHHRSE